LGGGGAMTEQDVWDATIAGSVLRLRPKLMTVATTIFSLLPILWSTGVGSDLMKPIAAPIVGGMVTSTIHVLIVTPVIFYVNLVEPDRPVVPFVALGGGIYHASFDMGRPGMFGHYGWRDGPGMMGSMWYGPGAMVGTGPLPWPDHVPQFYARRLGGVTPPLDGRWHMRSFTDPMVVVGGGVRIDLGQRFFVRPDARALIVFGDGDTHTVGMLNIGVGVRF
jgi:hypothetical protein